MTMDKANHSEVSASGTVVSESNSEHSDAPRAYLYRTTDTSAGWTASIPWKADDLIDLKHCPVSGETVGMVCDGSVVASITEEPTSTQAGDCENTVVRFKFGKKTYQLSTAAVPPPTSSAPNSTMPSGGGYNGWIGSWWFGTTAANVGKDHTADTPWLAQDRIAEALGLASLKILHKGRLLYESKSKGKTATKTASAKSTAVPHQEPTAVSQNLLAISEDDWKSNDTKKKATLVVMGTRTQDTLKEPPPSDNNAGAGSRTAGPWQLVQGLVAMPFHLLRWTVALTWHFVSSILPFAALPDDRRQRPHQD